MLQSTAQILDLMIASFVFGGTVWFFFVQSPALIKWMGRDKFVPIQMRLTKVLFKTLTIALAAGVAMTILHGGFIASHALISIVIAFLSVAFNNYYVIPRALKAGGKGRVEEKDQSNDTSFGRFASEGSGPSAKFWHRMVVLFVVLMLAGLVPHMITLLG